MGRYDILRRIKQLDPRTDHHEIHLLSRAYEFPFDYLMGGMQAYFHDFSIPTVSALLDHTNEFGARTVKRFEDTGIILLEIVKHGYDSPRGREAMRHMNQIHRRFNIGNEDFLYVLTTVIYEPIYWIDRFGYRPLSENEKLASFYFWREVGRRMHITGMPDTYAALEQFKHRYECEHVVYTDASRRVGEATWTAFAQYFPRWLRPLARQCLFVGMDDVVRRAFALRRPSPLVMGPVVVLLRMRAAVIRHSSPRKEPFFSIDQPQISYPNGYTIREVGPSNAPSPPPRLS